MHSISTHILDVSRGKPAADVKVALEYFDGDFKQIAEGVTNADGRVRDWVVPMKIGTWRLRFEIESYFKKLKETAFYPFVEIVFTVNDVQQHYHVPLLLSAYGYSTYRGSYPHV